MMKIAETEQLNYATSHNLGMQALYEIATLPEPERTKEHGQKRTRSVWFPKKSNQYEIAIG